MRRPPFCKPLSQLGSLRGHVCSLAEARLAMWSLQAILSGCRSEIQLAHTHDRQDPCTASSLSMTRTLRTYWALRDACAVTCRRLDGRARRGRLAWSGRLPGSGCLAGGGCLHASDCSSCTAFWRHLKARNAVGAIHPSLIVQASANGWGAEEALPHLSGKWVALVCRGMSRL